MWIPPGGRRILPVADRGKSDRNSISRGTLWVASRSCGELPQQIDVRRARNVSGRDNGFDSADRFALFHRNDNARTHTREGEEHIFDFQRVDFKPADIDEQLESAGETEIAMIVDGREIAGREKPICREPVAGAGR